MNCYENSEMKIKTILPEKLDRRLWKSCVNQIHQKMTLPKQKILRTL